MDITISGEADADIGSQQMGQLLTQVMGKMLGSLTDQKAKFCAFYSGRYSKTHDLVEFPAIYAPQGTWPWMYRQTIALVPKERLASPIPITEEEAIERHPHTYLNFALAYSVDIREGDGSGGILVPSTRRPLVF
jgi:hypothetical protein